MPKSLLHARARDPHGQALFELLVREFCGAIGQDVHVPPALAEAAVNFIGSMPDDSLRPLPERRARLVRLMNRKLRANEGPIKRFVDGAASLGVVFNFHEKAEIERAFDGSDRDAIERLISAKGMAQPTLRAIRALFEPVGLVDTERLLQAELRATLNRRTKARHPEGARDLVLSLLGGFLFSCFDEQAAHQVNDPVDEGDYEGSYWERLHKHHEHLFSRTRTLAIRLMPAGEVAAEEARNSVESWLEDEWERLDNHGFAALVLLSAGKSGNDPAWALAAAAMLFAERFAVDPRPPRFFRAAGLRRELAECVELDPRRQQSLVRLYEGFLFKDAFVLPEASEDSYAIVFLFQKNRRDETVLPCPACRSHLVSTNSYPSLGVRSWECGNWICPDRSRANRGKRYAFWSLLTQQAVLDEKSNIPKGHVRKWSRDVVSGATLADAIEMLIRHYSLSGDGIALSGMPACQETHMLGRRVTAAAPTPRKAASASATANLRQFRELYLSRPSRARPAAAREIYDDGRLRVICGDAAHVLETLSPESIDGAVTSPPYYNAREYAQWHNIYCHLADMADVARGCFKALKPGAYYLYNVFDYFDNDNTVVASAMGKRRIILSAYSVDIFCDAGFELVGATVWDKGEIEGKRAFNGGNFSSFYQAPFNCWEHVLLFRKPGDAPEIEFPFMLTCPPVKKMFRGENRHGHTAPFPDALPALLVERLAPDAVVLDPLGGSLTTGRVARRLGRRSVCIEREPSYCELGVKMLREEPLCGEA
jgi:DNA modification methylase